jgi:molybdopterin/thiamine biosynthesis adenylyltransferase
LRTAETPQGEPVSIRFPSLPGTVIFVPGAALALSSSSASGSGRLAFSGAEPPQFELRALLCELVEKPFKGPVRALAKADEELARHFGGAQVPFRWVRLSEPPVENTVESVLSSIEAVRGESASPPWHSVPGGRMAIAAAVLREEVAQGELGDAWIFAVRVRPEGGQEGAFLVRGQPLSREVLQARLPDPVRLGNKTVSLVGLGSVGSALAIELARAGLAELRGMDSDTVDAGTTVRWALGQSAAGRWKGGAIARLVARDYPYTRFTPVIHRLGQSAHRRTARQSSELDVLEEFLAGADLLVDATAEIGVQHVLADLADERELAQLYVSSTEGARGGLVARVLPGVTGCWLCLQHHLDDGTIPAPASDATQAVQPRGCGASTFVGAGFDITSIVAHGARVAVATLTESGSEREERERPDVFVCSFPAERSLPPQWTAHPLTQHPRCGACAERAS